MTRSRALLPILAGAVALAACSDDIASPAAPRPTDTQVAAPDPRVLADRIPEFGGYFLDESGTPTVWVTEESAKAEAIGALEGFARARGFDRGKINVRHAQFRYTDLANWFDAVTPAHAIDGVVFTDLDEANNTVTVGVTNRGLAQQVLNFAKSVGIPQHAIRIQETEEMVQAATLTQQVRPVIAGLQINYGNYVCTLGWNAVVGGQNSYITNSHCTGTQGGVDGIVHYQSASNQANSRIGVEVADPLYIKGGSCPKGKKCRYSDSSRGAYDAGVSFSRGVIARTLSSGQFNGSLTIDGSFSITSKGGAPVVGEVLNKVGRTTGWTAGPVTNTCVNTSVGGSTVFLYCQTFVSTGVLGGDSGSPVFSGTSGVQLRGILWGGNSAGTQMVMSPIGQIEQELGTMTVN